MTGQGGALITRNGAALTGRSLPELEAVIERGIQTFMDVGRALKEIRDRDLHHEAGHKNFDTYCKERWGFTRIRAHQLIGAAETTETLTMVNVLPGPANERQAREVAKAPPEDQPAVWQEAVETAPNGKVTAAHVAEVVERRRDPEPVTAQEADEDDTPVPGEQGYRAFTQRLRGLAHVANEAARLLETRVTAHDFREQQIRNLDRRLTDLLIGAETIKQVVDLTVERRRTPPAPKSQHPSGGGQRERLLSSIPIGASLTPSQLAEASGLTYKAVTQRTTELVREGKLLRSGEPGRFRYSLAEDA